MNHDRKVKFNNCYILGPTGPTGPMGPQGLPSAQVSVGTTTTGEANSQALVYSSGNENHVILNFVIPKGDIGPVPNIIIGKVITGDPGSQANVKISPIYDYNE